MGVRYLAFRVRVRMLMNIDVPVMERTTERAFNGCTPAKRTDQNHSTVTRFVAHGLIPFRFE